MKNTRILSILIVIVLLIAGGVYVMVTKDKTVEIITPVANSEWKTYTNPRYKFEMQYPSTWKFIEPSGTDQWAVRFYNSMQVTAPDSDQPADVFVIKTKCDVPTSKIWDEGFGGFSYRHECVSGFGVILSAISEESKVTLERMLTTLKFTNK